MRSRGRLEDSISLVGSTADAIENVMSELHPPMVDTHGLLPALHWYAKEFSQRTGIDAAVSGKARKRWGGTSRSKRCPAAVRKSWFGSLADMTIRILIADDHGVVAEGMRSLIQAQADMEVIACVQDGREAVRWTMETSPDVVLMDNAMPELNGTAATQIICERRAETRVIMLSMYSDPIHVCRALQAGATGYVAKKSVAKEVVDAYTGGP